MKLIRESQYISFEGKREFDEVFPLIRKYDRLGPNARRVLLALADRLVKGVEHGDFDKPHDWDRESAEEALDLAVYQAAKLLGLGKAAESAEMCSCFADYDCPMHEWKGSPELDDAERTSDTIPAPADVSPDGRTPDGCAIPWVPPVGAKVRVVHYWKGSAFLKSGGKLDRVYTVASAGPWGFDEITVEFEELKHHGYLVRVVPA